MADALPRQRMTHAEYVVYLDTAANKHEFLRGDVFAMAGGTPEHARLAARVLGELGRSLRGKGCEAFSADLRVRIEATDLDTFPDVSVVCGALVAASGDPNAVLNPTLLVEVLSDSTEAYDRGPKFAHYRQIPSLQEYLLVSQHEPRLELFRRGPKGTWIFVEATAGETMTLESVDVVLDVSTLFATELG